MPRKHPAAYDFEQTLDTARDYRSFAVASGHGIASVVNWGAVTAEIDPQPFVRRPCQLALSRAACVLRGRIIARYQGILLEMSGSIPGPRSYSRGDGASGSAMGPDLVMAATYVVQAGNRATPTIFSLTKEVRPCEP